MKLDESLFVLVGEYRDNEARSRRAPAQRLQRWGHIAAYGHQHSDDEAGRIP